MDHTKIPVRQDSATTSNHSTTLKSCVSPMQLSRRDTMYARSLSLMSLVHDPYDPSSLSFNTPEPMPPKIVVSKPHKPINDFLVHNLNRGPSDPSSIDTFLDNFGDLEEEEDSSDTESEYPYEYELAPALKVFQGMMLPARMSDPWPYKFEVDDPSSFLPPNLNHFRPLIICNDVLFFFPPSL